MEIGTEKPMIVIEPVEDPVPAEREPAPVEAEPVEAPVEEPVPAGVPA
jgi:hypothetical protein